MDTQSITPIPRHSKSDMGHVIRPVRIIIKYYTNFLCFTYQVIIQNVYL